MKRLLTGVLAGCVSASLLAGGSSFVVPDRWGKTFDTMKEGLEDSARRVKLGIHTLDKDKVERSYKEFEQLSENKAQSLGLTDQAIDDSLLTPQEAMQLKKEYLKNYRALRADIGYALISSKHNLPSEVQLQKEALNKRNDKLWALLKDGTICAGSTAAFFLIQSDYSSIALPFAVGFGLFAIYDGKQAYNAHKEYKGAPDRVKNRTKTMVEIENLLAVKAKYISSQKEKEVSDWNKEQNEENLKAEKQNKDLNTRKIESEIELNKAKTEWKKKQASRQPFKSDNL